MGNQLDPAILFERRDTTAILQFNRSETRNPLSSSTLDQLGLLLNQAENDLELVTLVLTGSGNIFASGADLREVSRLTSNSAVDFSRQAQKLFNRLTDSRLLTIAAVNGTCMGGALDLMLSCKRRIASPDAKFGHPGVRLGIITGWGGTQRMPRLIGRACALDLMLTARMIAADEALALGLVDELAENTADRALSYTSVH
jgi:enoyl-CoA hydratase